MAVRILILILTFAMACAKTDVAPETVGLRSVEDGVHVPAVSRAFIHTQTVGLDGGSPPVRAPGRLEFREGSVSKINSAVEGQVTEVHVQVGARVSTGDPLVTLKSLSAAASRAELPRLSLAVQSARAEVERQQRLQAGNVGVESELFAARMALQEAEADLKQARDQIQLVGNGRGADVVVRAPMDGTILHIHTSLGQVAEPGGEPLIELGDPNALRVVAEVFEQDLPLLKDEARAQVMVSSSTSPLEGRVIRIGSLVDRGVRRVPVHIELDANDGSLRAGMTARIEIETKHEGGIAVPGAAVLIKDESQYVVWVEDGADGSGQFRSQNVEIGHIHADRVSVLHGLKEGDRVVVKGALLLDTAAGQLL